MRVLLDSSGYSVHMRGHVGVEETLAEAETIYLNPIVLEFLRKAGTPIGTNGLRIASTATQLGLTVVTTDTD